MDHLCSKGHDKFGFINVSEKYNFAYLRKKGFKNGLKKQVTAPSFRLKGSGWYETDFKTGKKKNLSDGSSKKESVNTVADSKKADKKDKIS